MASPKRGCAHPITAHYSIIDLERIKGWVSLVGWTYSGRFTHISGHPSAAGRAYNRKFAGHRPTFYHCATPQAWWVIERGSNQNRRGSTDVCPIHHEPSRRYWIHSSNHQLCSLHWERFTTAYTELDYCNALLLLRYCFQKLDSEKSFSLSICWQTYRSIYRTSVLTQHLRSMAVLFQRCVHVEITRPDDAT